MAGHGLIHHKVLSKAVFLSCMMFNIPQVVLQHSSLLHVLPDGFAFLQFDSAQRENQPKPTKLSRTSDLGTVRLSLCPAMIRALPLAALYIPSQRGTQPGPRWSLEMQEAGITPG